MTPLNHGDARSLLNRSLDARLSGADRRALDEHLATCDACSAYAADLQRLNAHLFESLQARWADPNYSSLELDRGLKLAGQRVRHRSTQRRLLLRAQPAVWTLGAIALISVMAFIINAVRPQAVVDPTDAPTENVIVEATSGATVPATDALVQEPTRGICTAEVIESANLHKGPNAGYVIERVVVAGQTGQVLARYGSGSDMWLQVYFKESESLEYVGWLLRDQLSLTGDCGNLTDTSQSVAEVPTTASQSTSPAMTATQGPATTATPIFDPNGVCFVAPGEFGPAERLNVYSGPGTTYSVVGQLTVGQYVEAVGIFSQPNYNTWIGVHFESEARMSWVDGTYYMFDGRGTNGCWPLPAVEVYPAPPTFTPSPTYQPTTVAPNMDINNIVYINDTNPTTSWTRTLTADGVTRLDFGVRINDVPPGEFRELNIMIQCDAAPGIGVWTIYGGRISDWGCGSAGSHSGISQSNNFVAYTVVLPDGMTSLTFTIKVILQRN